MNGKQKCRLFQRQCHLQRQDQCHLWIEDTGCDGEPMDITGLGVRCQVSTTPLGDRLRGGVPSEEGDDFVVERRAAANNAFYFNVDRAATARLSPGELTLAIFLSTEEWMDIAETVIGRVVKLR